MVGRASLVLLSVLNVVRSRSFEVWTGDVEGCGLLADG